MKTKRRTAPTAEQKAAAQAKRAELIALSRTVKAGMESGLFPEAEKVNDAIVATYQARTGQSDFRSFARWREEGMQVRKGERGFPVWGQPRTANKAEPSAEPNTDPETAKYRLFPLAYVFHAGQVEPLDPSKPRRERSPRTEPQPREPRQQDQQPRRGNPEIADRLRALADGMAGGIESKLNPGIANQNPTRRRHAIAESMRQDGRTLDLARTILRAAADCHEGNPDRPSWIPELDSAPAPSLLTVTTKKAAIDYARGHGKAVRDAMARAGHVPTAPDWKAKYRAALGSLIGAKYDGFFPTGDRLAARVAELAQLDQPEPLAILEPSAGTGALALAALERIHAGSKIWTVERVPALSAVLDIIAEGHPEQVANLGTGDFLAYEDGQFSGPAEFDRIVMNPPFERGQDMQHVQAAYSLLKPGGILVAIVCENCFYRTDGEYPDFRDWLASNGAEIEKAPEDAFSGTIRGTKTAARVITIRKD